MRRYHRGLAGNSQGAKIGSGEIIIPRDSVWVEGRQRDGEGEDGRVRARDREKEQPPENEAVFEASAFLPLNPPVITPNLLRRKEGRSPEVGIGGGQLRGESLIHLRAVRL